MARLALLLLLCLSLGACSPHTSGPSEIPYTVAPQTPPDDYWLSVTVTGPIRENMSAYEALPRALRPARYVVEADHILRAAIGPGTKDDAFPSPTRRLSPTEIQQLYRLTTEAGFLDADHPAIVGAPPPPKQIDPTEAMDRDLRTMYIISLHAGHKRRTLVMEASPRGNEDSREAARVIDWLANKAWLKPSMQAK